MHSSTWSLLRSEWFHNTTYNKVWTLLCIFVLLHYVFRLLVREFSYLFEGIVFLINTKYFRFSSSILKNRFSSKIIRFYFYTVERRRPCDVTLLMGSGEWLATPLCARRQRQVGWWSLIEAVQWRNYSGRKSSPSALLAHIWQSTPFKMAYHSPYKAPPHINAPPDQGFLWNIFQRWVAERGGLSRCCVLPLTPLRSESCCRLRRGEEQSGAGCWCFSWQLSHYYCFLSNYFWFTEVPRTEISDLSGLRLPQLWSFQEILLHIGNSCYTSHSWSHYNTPDYCTEVVYVAFSSGVKLCWNEVTGNQLAQPVSWLL